MKFGPEFWERRKVIADQQTAFQTAKEASVIATEMINGRISKAAATPKLTALQDKARRLGYRLDTYHRTEKIVCVQAINLKAKTGTPEGEPDPDDQDAWIDWHLDYVCGKQKKRKVKKNGSGRTNAKSVRGNGKQGDRAD